MTADIVTTSAYAFDTLNCVKEEGEGEAPTLFVYAARAARKGGGGGIMRRINRVRGRAKGKGSCPSATVKLASLRRGGTRTRLRGDGKELYYYLRRAVGGKGRRSFSLREAGASSGKKEGGSRRFLEKEGEKWNL